MLIIRQLQLTEVVCKGLEGNINEHCELPTHTLSNETVQQVKQFSK